MRKKIGVLCVILGIVCLISSVGFIVYNRIEAQNALKTSDDMLKDVQIAIKEPAADDAIMPTEMATVKVEGNDCIGILSIPVLDLELPVLTDWSYAKLKKAPCHYFGSCYEKDFVIAAHNYKSHFGRLSELQAGDKVIFTDAKGFRHNYEVVLLETLQKNATEEMIASGFDLSLYTCTTAGGSRVTARCKAAD